MLNGYTMFIEHQLCFVYIIKETKQFILYCAYSKGSQTVALEKTTPEKQLAS